MAKKLKEPHDLSKLYDIILIDQRMLTEQTGITCEKLAAHVKNANIVAMTDMDFTQAWEHVCSFGSAKIFPKPATSQDLKYALATKDLPQESTIGSQATKQEQQAPGQESNSDSSLPQDSQEDRFIDDIKNSDAKVLIVEDNEVNQFVVQGLLEEFHLHADIANNGSEAMDMLVRANSDNNNYQLVIMDCHMPKMDGYDASQNIRNGYCGEENRAIPIVAMTANAMEGDREKCLAAGMSDYMTKPVDPDVLLTKLHQWLVVTVEHKVQQ